MRSRPSPTRAAGRSRSGPAAKSTPPTSRSYGTLTLAPGPSVAAATRLTNTGTSPLYFNGGSRTFIGTPQTAGQNLALVDLHGQNAIVAGGLFVNNGFVGDSTGSGATIVADFGSLVKGAGTFANSVITQNGGKFQAGNSPGIAHFGHLVLGPGGTQAYNWQINNAMGSAGGFQEGPFPDLRSGWGLMSVEQVADPLLSVTSSGDLTWSATMAPGAQFQMSLQTLLNPTPAGTDNPGSMANFDPRTQYIWKIVQWQGNYTGPTDDGALTATADFDLTNFVNPHPGTFSLHLGTGPFDFKAIDLVYTPVPEPGTLALLGLAAVGGWRWRRRW